MRTRGRSRFCAPCFLALAALAATAQEPCPEVGPLANADGTARVVCPCFASGEEAGAVFRAPAEDYPLEVLRVGFAWSSQFGGSPQSLESAVRVYAGALPSPGAPIFELEGPVLTDGFINEFDLEPLPGEIAIESRPFLVALKFFNENAGDIFAPSVVHDGNGCRAGRNAVFAIPGGWRDACSLGVTGDWLIQVVYRPFGCGPGEERFIRADDNGDGGVDISDAVFGLDVLFLGGTALCLEAMDSNGDEQHDLSDAVYTLNFLFSGGPPPLAPFPGCGSDAGETDLGCQTPPEACA